MIFDSPRMQRLRAKYAEVPDKAPQIVFLDRYDGWASERQYLEEVIAGVPASKQNAWLGSLLKGDDIQFISAWFEMLLVGWLEQLGPVTVEPKHDNGAPDFMVQAGGRECYIEARVKTKSAAELVQEKRDAELFAALRSVALPYEVTIEEFQYGDALDMRLLVKAVENWLRNAPDSAFSFENRDNIIRLSACLNPKLKAVSVIELTPGCPVNPHDLQRPLQEKATKYKSLSSEGKAYVIAVLLESFRYSAEEVAEVWFGRPTAVVDAKQGKVIEERLDGSGLHFLGNEVRHRRVSGTLVFRAWPDNTLGRRVLRGAYIQNPFASQPIDPALFPVASRFVVLDKTERHYRMSWVSDT